MRVQIRHNWVMSHDFACHSKACAPPPVGAGGSSAGGGLSVFQHRNLTRIVAATARGAGAPMTQAESKGLVARGLVERVSGKGQGFGNSPVWKATKKGTEMLRGPEPTIPGKKLPRAIRMGPPGTKEHLVVGETETHYKLGGYRISKADLKPHMILD